MKIWEDFDRMRLKMRLILDHKKIFTFLMAVQLFFGLLLWFPPDLLCQNSGFKYLKNYTPNEYKGQGQNWSILQDKRGIIYVANQGGLLEFDGVSWRLIPITKDSGPVRSIAIDDGGTIYIGGENQIGFLTPDPKGALIYESLLDHLDNNYKNFATVWGTHATKDGIYFRTSKFLFRWEPTLQQMKVWEPTHQFNASFMCGGELFIHQEKVGLMYMKDESLEIIPGDGTFADEKIYMLVPYEANKLLIGTRENGFYIFDMVKKKKQPFFIEIGGYLKEGLLSHGIRLTLFTTKSAEFALATLQGGLVIIDSHGKVKQIFTKTYGLQDNDVRYVFEDSQGNLWLGMNSGISKIEYISPFSIYDDRSNLPGRVLSVIRHHKYLYAGTNSGLYSFTPSDKFIPIRGIPGMCWSLLSIDDSLLVATTTYGVFQVGNKDEINSNGVRRAIDAPSYVLLQSRADSNRIWVGTDHGLVSLYPKKQNGKRQWEMERKFDDITEEIRTIAEDRKGNLWLGTLTKGVLRVDFPGERNNITPSIVTRYNIKNGLPPGNVNVYWGAGHIIFATGKGIYQFNEQKNVFVPDSTLGSEFSDGSKGFSYIAEDKNKNIWFHSESRNYQAIHGPGESFKINSIPFRRIPATMQVNHIYPDPDGKTTWFAAHGGLIRYDTTVKKNYQQDFQTLVRKVYVNRTLISEGYRNKTGKTSEELFPVFKYKKRNLRFEFAAPFFEGEIEMEYQSYLEGYDEDWTALNKDSKRNYINLAPGLYTFRVRAKNVYGYLGGEDVFQFKILPPWYQTWWAYLLYGVGSFLLIFLVVKWRAGKLAGKLEKEKQRLEQIVKERTKEINEKTQQLEAQTTQLKDQSEKLQEMDKVKSRFFANISHEFRTPLTLIMSPLEQMIFDSRDKKQKEALNVMLRNSQHLLTLINQLLDLSRLDSGKMKLQAAHQNIVPFIKSTLASFQMLAQQNQLILEFHSQEEDISLYFDAQTMEEVMYNLLINAVKFTPHGGKIAISVSKEEGAPPGFVKISVQDTGIGIPTEQLPHIFDRFSQAKSFKEKGRKGTGIGLALAKEIVVLHHGKIDVHSLEEKGTEFVILLPMGHEHLKPGEIAASPETAPVPGKDRDIEALYMIPGEEVECEAAEESEKGTESVDVEKNVILVVEDHADVRKYIRDPLEPLYTVVEACDGKEGIAKAKEIIPDLIVSDIMMPEKDGYDLCRDLKTDVKTSHIPIVLLTAKASEESIIHGLETGADDYITKPFNTKILLTRIKNLIELRRQLQLKIQRQKMLLPSEISVSPMDKEFFKEFQDVIEKNLSDPEFNIDVLSAKLYMSRATLFRKIQALTGETPNLFIQSYRLERGAQLLRENYGNVTEVAMAVGFSTPQYFARRFKEKFHQSPSAFHASESSVSIKE